MKKIFICIFSTLFLINEGNANISDEQERYWKEAFSQSAFTNVLQSFNGNFLWPVIFSKQYSSKIPNDVRRKQEVFLNLSNSFAKNLEIFEKDLGILPWESFSLRVELLINTRDHIAKSPSYINILLVDAINRVLFVNLANRLTIDEPVENKVIPIVEKLGEYTPNMEIFIDILSDEMNTNFFQKVELMKMTGAEIYKKIWPFLQGDAPIVFPRNIQNAGTMSLLEKRDIGLLLWRIALSDFQLKTLLPAAFDYKNKVDSFSINIDYEDIIKVLGKERKDTSLGGQLVGSTASIPGETSELFEKISTGKIAEQLLFRFPSRNIR